MRQNIHTGFVIVLQLYERNILQSLLGTDDIGILQFSINS